MVLGFDLRALQEGFKAHKNRGIGVCVRNIVSRQGLAPEGLDIKYWYEPTLEADEPKSFGATPYRRGAIAKAIGPRLKESLNQVLVMRKVIENTARHSGAETIFFPSHLDTPPGLATPYAVTAHDMIQAAMMERLYSSMKDRLHIKMQISALKKARLIIAVSAYTRDDLVRYAGCDAKKIEVVHNGVDSAFRPGVTEGAERFDLPEKFILYVGGIDGRKNINLLFDSFSELSALKPEYHLVMTGDVSGDKLYKSHVAAMEKRGIKDRVRALGFVSNEELIAMYNRATIFVYPSLYEGFGLPVAEAMACGAAILTTSRASIPEVAGDGAMLVDPDDPVAFTKALVTLAENETLRKELGEKGILQAKKYTWDKCAKETFQLLGEM